MILDLVCMGSFPHTNIYTDEVYMSMYIYLYKIIRWLHRLPRVDVVLHALLPILAPLEAILEHALVVPCEHHILGLAQVQPLWPLPA